MSSRKILRGPGLVGLSVIGRVEVLHIVLVPSTPKRQRLNLTTRHEQNNPLDYLIGGGR
jgi:hypothetical protein